MVRFLFKLSLFLPIAAGLAWVNWHVDPARIFGRHASDPAWYEYERFLARSLIEGSPQRLAAVHNELILDELMFRHFDRLDVLVLGSSSAKPIHKELYGGQSFFNGAYFGARLEEMMGVEELAREAGLRPRRVVLAIEPAKLQTRTGPVAPSFVPLLSKVRARLHLSDEAEQASRWAALCGSLVAPLGEEASNVVQSIFNQYDTLFSPSYCQYCLRLLIQSTLQRGAGDQFVEQFQKPNQHLLYPDGSLEWCEVFTSQTPDNIRRSTGKPPTESITDDSLRPAPERCRVFEAFVNELLQSGTAVEFFLPPPNPWLFEAATQELQKSGKSNPTAETEAYLRSFAAQHGIRVRGSYDPRRAGVTEEDFVDLVHLRREAIERIWNVVASQLNK
jgi:hypothetical protein